MNFMEYLQYSQDLRKPGFWQPQTCPNLVRKGDFGEILAWMGWPEWWKWQCWLDWLGNWFWWQEQEAKWSSVRGLREFGPKFSLRAGPTYAR